MVVDAGNLLAPYARIQEVERGQRALKAEGILKAYAHSGVDAMTVGSADFALGKDFLLSQIKTLNLPFVCANLTDSRTGEQLFPASVMVSAGDVRVGIFGLTGQRLEVEGLTASDPIPAAKKAVADLKKQGARLIVALANVPLQDQDTLAQDVPGIDVIVAGSSRQKLDTPRMPGKALLVEAGSRGKYVGFLEMNLFPDGKGWYDAGATQRDQKRLTQLQKRVDSLRQRLPSAKTEVDRLRMEQQIIHYQDEIAHGVGKPPVRGKMNVFHPNQVALSKDVADDPAVVELVKNTMKQVNRPEAYGAQVAPTPSALPASALPQQPFGNYVGADACKTCHPREYDDWKTTPHARAYQSLVKDHRELDLQCFGCHITGNKQPGGPTDPRQVGYLKDVQCEVCHDAGRDHVLKPNVVHVTKATPIEICVTCHTPEQTDGQFIYGSYIQRVDHSGRHLILPPLRKH